MLVSLLSLNLSLDETNKDGYTPLHYCCIHKPSLVNVLLKAKGGKELVNVKDKVNGWAPIHIAVSASIDGPSDDLFSDEFDNSLIKILYASGADVDIQNNLGSISSLVLAN